MAPEYDLHDASGARKYLTADERERFAGAIDDALDGPRDRDKRTLAQLYYLTGCRRNEALAVRYRDVDYSEGGVRLRTLKRRRVVFRFVPLPEAFLTRLDDVHRVRDEQLPLVKARPDDPVWAFDKTTAWRTVKRVMAAASLRGPHATTKGLRHGFVIAHMLAGTPEHMIARWAGWSSTAMMAVYGRAVGAEERELAARLW